MSCVDQVGTWSMVLIGLSTAAAFTQSASMRQIIAEQLFPGAPKPCKGGHRLSLPIGNRSDCATARTDDRPFIAACGDRYLPPARITTAEISFTSTKAS